MNFDAGHPFTDPEAATRKRSLAASSPTNGQFLCEAGRARNWDSTSCRARNQALSLSVAPLEPTDLLELTGSSGRSGKRKALSTSIGRVTAMMDENLARMRTHLSAIQRHRRLLKTKLTEHDRQYVCRRLSEEQCALESLRAATFPIVFTESPRPMTSAS
ncbi:hypothetical protein ACYCVF_31425 [Bradyrhizobium sp. 1.29L]